MPPPPPGTPSPNRPNDDDPPQFKGEPGGGDDDAPDAGDDADGQQFEPLIGKKQIMEAYERMKQALKKIGDDNKAAGGDQDEAVKKLREAKDELEKRLRMLRLEEMERILAALKARCEKMLAMQTDVLTNPVDGTEATDKAVQNNSDKKPNDANFQSALRLGDKEKEIISIVNGCLEILRTDGTGVAFPVAFEQVRDDMRQVFRRFQVADVGKFNQDIQRDIIDSLKDMIDALKKKEQDLQDAKQQPPGPPGEPKEPPEPGLLKKIQELKMLRAMQDRLNKRTERYARLFPGQEQSSDPIIRREVSDLRIQQERIFDTANKIHKGDNK